MLVALLALSLAAPPADPFALAPNDRVVFVGGTLVEREQKSGDWELALRLRNPGVPVAVRNLGWSGDTVAGDARNGFDDNPKGFDRLVTLTRDLKPTVVVVAYGQAESFAGPAAVADFKAGLTRLLDALKPTGARLVLVSPPPFEANPALPDPGPNNANLALYAGAIRDVAAARSAAFIDLFGRVRDATLPPRTDNGLHLTPAGYAATAGLLVGGPAVPAGPAVEAVRAKVVAKNRLFFYRWRPQNETYLFGFRKNEQGKNAVEVAAFDPLVTAAEAEINAELSRGSTSRPR